MKRRAPSSFAIVVLAMVMLQGQPVSAAPQCIRDFFKTPQTLAFTSADVEILARKVAQAVGEDPGSIKILPCDDTAKIVSFYADTTQHQVPAARYILYNKDWVRESVGFNWSGPHGEERRQWITVIIGHELGHFIMKHFTTRQFVSPIDKEVEADNFAGCAAATLVVPWKIAEDILSNVREEDDSSYPGRNHSLAAAQKGFNRCVGKTSVEPVYRFRSELQDAVLRDDAPEVNDLLLRGADANMPLAGNISAADYAWENGRRLAFDQLVLGGARLNGNHVFDQLIIKLVTDERTSPEVLRAALKNGAPVVSDPVYGIPGCVAVRSTFRAILKEVKKHICPVG